MNIQSELKRNRLTDLHDHLIPGVDDGSPNLETSLALLEREYADGVRKMILTPHYRPGVFENTEEEIRTAYDNLCQVAGDRFPDLELYLGCELHAHMDMVEAIRTRPQFRMAGSDFILVEFSNQDERSYIRKRLYELCASGYRPIVAHTERYANLVKDLRFVQDLVDMGVMLQVNADSVLGKDGWRVRRFCRALMDRDLLHFIGSDAHDLKYRPPRMGECASYLEKKLGAFYMQKVMCENPKEIICGGFYGQQ